MELENITIQPLDPTTIEMIAELRAKNQELEQTIKANAQAQATLLQYFIKREALGGSWKLGSDGKNLVKLTDSQVQEITQRRLA